jgi:hypothetical protein
LLIQVNILIKKLDTFIEHCESIKSEENNYLSHESSFSENIEFLKKKLDGWMNFAKIKISDYLNLIK